MTIHCGNDEISWFFLQTHQDWLEPLLPPEVRTLEDFRTCQQTKEKMYLFEAMWKTRNHNSSDKRDKIYALLNITSDGSDVVPTPNYKLNVDTVFYRAFEEYVTSDPKLSYLVRSEISNQSIDPAKWPTWSSLEYGLPSLLIDILMQKKWMSTKPKFPRLSVPRCSLPWNDDSLPFDDKASAIGDTSAHVNGLPCISNKGLIANAFILDTIESTKYDSTVKQPPNQNESDLTPEEAMYNISNALGAATFRSFNRPFEFRDHVGTVAYLLAKSFAPIEDTWETESGIQHSLESLLSPHSLLYHGKSVHEWSELYTQTAGFMCPGDGESGALQLAIRAELNRALRMATDSNMQLAIGRGHFLGLVPDNTRGGDIVVCIQDATMSMILRPEERGYFYIGEASSYVYGPHNGITTPLELPTAFEEVLVPLCIR